MHLNECKEGDMIRQLNGSGESFAVTLHYGTHLVAVRTITVMNPSKWVTGDSPIRKIADLQPGMRLRNLGSNNVYVVTQALDQFGVAVQSVVIDAREAARWKRVVEASLKLLD